MRPTVEDHVTSQGADVIEESFAGAEFATDLLREGVREFKDGVKQESQQVEGEQDSG